MAQRQRLWAARERLRLLRLYGNKCNYCGETANLTFDCIKPQGDAHHRASGPERIIFYRKQARAGNLQVLCFECNVHKGAHPQARYLPVPPDAEPSIAMTRLCENSEATRAAPELMIDPTNSPF